MFNSIISQLLAWSLQIKNQTQKYGNTETLVGGLFEQIIALIKSITDYISNIIFGFIRQPGVDTYNDTSDGKTSLLNSYPAPEKGWTVLVRNDETNGGKATLYQWNGTNWINLETVVYDDDITLNGGSSMTAAKLNASRLFNLTGGLRPEETNVLPAILNVFISGTSDAYKLTTILNTVTYPYRVIMFNTTTSTNIIMDFAGATTLTVVDPSNGASITVSVNWSVLGSYQLNLPDSLIHLLLSPQCYERFGVYESVTNTQNSLYFNYLSGFSQNARKIINVIKKLEIYGTLVPIRVTTLVNLTAFPRRVILTTNESPNKTYIIDFPDGVYTMNVNTPEGINIIISVDWTQVPNGTTLINVSGFNNSPLTLSQRCYYPNKTILKTDSIKGKNLAFLGDSIIMMMDPLWDTTPGDNRKWDTLKAKLNAFDLMNLGLGGATWRERGDANITDTPTYNSEQSFVSNEVRRLVRLVNAGTRPAPNVIAIACGTNDANTIVTDNFDTVMALSYSDLILPANEALRGTFFGGMRVALEMINANFPDATIILFSPTQAIESLRPLSKLQQTRDAIKKMAEKYACIFVDALAESALTAMYETSSGGKYTYDGLHPNAAKGRPLLTNYYAKRLETNYFSYI